MPVTQCLVGSVGNSIAQIDARDHVQYSHHQHPRQPPVALATIQQAAEFQCCSYSEWNLCEERNHNECRKGILAETGEAVGAQFATAGANFARGGADEFDTSANRFAENGGHGQLFFVLCGLRWFRLLLDVSSGLKSTHINFNPVCN